MNGYASNIRVTLHADGSSITIEDDGRGIPVDKHPTTKKSALEVIFTVLHAGGKFEHGSYKTAGGLHGVGASVVNALSKELVATVKRDGAQWEMRFKQGKPVGPLKKIGPARGTGTTVYFHPDAAIFPKIEFDPAVIRERLEVASYLHKGLKVVFEDETHARRRSVFEHAEGLVDYLKKIVAERGAKPVHEAPFVAEQGRGAAARSRAAVDRGDRRALAVYVNGIPTGSGGTHENGLRAGLGKAVRNFIDTHNLSPKGVTLTAEDIREGLTGVLSVFIAGAAVPGADQGPAEQPRAAVRGRRRGPPGARALAEPQHQRRRGDRRAHHPRGARARGEPRGAGRGVAQERDVDAPQPAGQAERLHQLRRAKTASSSSSRAIRPAARPSRGATARGRRSCRCAARC